MKWNVGDLFRFKRDMSMHGDIDNHVGIVLGHVNAWNQWKVQVSHKVLWITKHQMATL